MPTRLTVLEYVLLGLAGAQPRSGYEMRRVFTETPMVHYSDSPGAIYPALRRLEKKGLLMGKTATGKTNRPTRVFHLTRKGQAAFRAWLAQPIRKGDVVWRMDELARRFAWMQPHLGNDKIRAFLEAFERDIAAHIKSLESFPVTGFTFCARMAFEGGILGYRTQLAWARKALTRLDRKESLS